MKVNGIADVFVVEDPTDTILAPQGKAYLRILFEDGTQIAVTLNIAAMIGGIAKGVIDRLGYEK